MIRIFYIFATTLLASGLLPIMIKSAYGSDIFSCTVAQYDDGSKGDSPATVRITGKEISYNGMLGTKIENWYGHHDPLLFGNLAFYTLENMHHFHILKIRYLSKNEIEAIEFGQYIDPFWAKRRCVKG